MSEKCTTFNVRAYTRTYSNGKSVTVSAHTRTRCTTSKKDFPNLKDYEGRNIKDICKIGFNDSSENHCAHFVSHVMGYSFGGATCANQSWDLKQTAKELSQEGATLRVDDLFRACSNVGKWEDKDESIDSCLVFIINKNNVNLIDKTMQNVRRKHVGIYHDNKVWHYSNSKNKVVSQTPEEFAKHYGSDPKYIIIYGTYPIVNKK